MFDIENCHFIVDDDDGPIVGVKPAPKGSDSLTAPQRQRIACQPFTSQVRCMTSPVATAVKCPDCRATPEWKAEFEKAGRPELRIDMIPKQTLDKIIAAQKPQEAAGGR